MSKFIKIIWSLISLVPLLFVVSLVFLADFLWNKAIACSLTIAIVLAALTVILCITCVLIMKYGICKLDKITFEIEEIESKDGAVSSSMVSYLLPLVTITFADVNWVAFIGLIFVMFLLLTSTRIVLLNPLLYLGKYKYYTIKAKSGAKYTLITKQTKFDKTKSKTMVEIFDDIYIEMEEK